MRKNNVVIAITELQGLLNGDSAVKEKYLNVLQACEKTCPKCKAKFLSTDTTKRHCSPKCQRADKQKRYRDKVKTAVYTDNNKCKCCGNKMSEIEAESHSTNGNGEFICYYCLNGYAEPKLRQK